MATESPSNKSVLDRLDRIPVWPYSYSLLWVLGAGYFFAFFDIVNIGAALPVIALIPFTLNMAGSTLE